MKLADKEQIEIDYWKDNTWENPGAFTKNNMLNKMLQVRTFDYKVNRFRRFFQANRKQVLELGAGQGWASCWLKRHYLPESQFTVTDISPYAIQSLHYWEDFFKAKIDKQAACKSYELPFADNSYHLIFCYAAAHHFVEYEKTLQEIKRVLKPNGVCLFLYEPVCSKYFYKWHYKYVNQQRHAVPEDVLIPNEIAELAQQTGLKMEIHYDTKQVLIRSLGIGLYFSVLEKLKFLHPILPNSADFVFRQEE